MRTQSFKKKPFKSEAGKEQVFIFLSELKTLEADKDLVFTICFGCHFGDVGSLFMLDHTHKKKFI